MRNELETLIAELFRLWLASIKDYADGRADAEQVNFAAGLYFDACFLLDELESFKH